MKSQSAVRSERSFWTLIQEMQLKMLELDKTPRKLQRLPVFFLTPSILHNSFVRVRKWSRTGNDRDIEPQMIPIKNEEWHGFISVEGESIEKNYELKNMFYHFTKKYSTVAILFFEMVLNVFTVTQ